MIGDNYEHCRQHNIFQAWYEQYRSNFACKQ